MRVILEIPKEILEELGKMAKNQKRSRKAFMELLLIGIAEGQNKAILAPISPSDDPTPPQIGKKPAKKPIPMPEPISDVASIEPGPMPVKVQNLTEEQPKSNYSVDTTPKKNFYGLLSMAKSGADRTLVEEEMKGVKLTSGQISMIRSNLK